MITLHLSIFTWHRRIDDIEDEITLPPLVQETVLLDLEPTAAKTYNLLQALVAVNAVDSERTGAVRHLVSLRLSDGL